MEQNESDHRIMYWSIKCTGQPWVWSKCQASEAIMNIGHIFLVWFICETRQKDIAKMKNTLLGIWTAIICLNFTKYMYVYHANLSFKSILSRTFNFFHNLLIQFMHDFRQQRNSFFFSIKIYKVQTWMMFG